MFRKGGGEETLFYPYPVPHCSILVMFSCNRLLIHPSSSCLQLKDLTVSKEAQEQLSPCFPGSNLTWIHPSCRWYLWWWWGKSGV